MKKRASGDFSIIIIFLFIGIILFLSLTLYNENQNQLKQDASISQLELDLTNVQLRNTELVTDLEKNNDMIDKVQVDLNKIKTENMELLNQKEQYEKQLETLRENPFYTSSKPDHERGNVRFAVLSDLHVGGPQGSDRPRLQGPSEFPKDSLSALRSPTMGIAHALAHRVHRTTAIALVRTTAGFV